MDKDVGRVQVQRHLAWLVDQGVEHGWWVVASRGSLCRLLVLRCVALVRQPVTALGTACVSDAVRLAFLHRNLQTFAETGNFRINVHAKLKSRSSSTDG